LLFCCRQFQCSVDCDAQTSAQKQQPLTSLRLQLVRLEDICESLHLQLRDSKASLERLIAIASEQSWTLYNMSCTNASNMRPDEGTYVLTQRQKEDIRRQ
ncbi:hypothetical protein L9F63_016049, partial [Diploptera punctata]